MSDPTPPPMIAEPVAPGVELGYAPPAKKKHRAVWVIALGLLTTALALGGSYTLAVKTDTNIMGWYANYIIPAGALLVGLVASSGYGLGVWALGVKVRRGLLITIIALLASSYFVAEYLEFRANGPMGLPTGTNAAGATVYRRIGFWEYYHLKAVNWAWKSRTSSGKEEDGKPLGGAGYFFVGLGLVGFCLGGLVIPFAVGKTAYCELCECYKKSKVLTTLPASVPVRKVSKKDTQGQQQYADEQNAAYEAGTAQAQKLVDIALAGDASVFSSATNATRPNAKGAQKLPIRLNLTLVQCPTCWSGDLVVTQVAGQGKHTTTNTLATIELTQAFSRSHRDLSGGKRE